jgi:hypothetical protein
MATRITTDELGRKSGEFFATVVKVLVERDVSRGDAYLDMELEDFIAFIRDKCARIKATIGNRGYDLRANLPVSGDTNMTRVKADLADSVMDIAGYAALLAIWLVHHKYLSEEGLTHEVPPT